MWLIGVIASWIDHAHAPLWLGCWFVGMLLMCAAVCCHARISRRRELRADALAAKLLGDTGPVLAMLDDLQVVHVRLGRMARLSGLLTHPSPSRRRRELLSIAADATPAQIQSA
jgi:Zn-dependent protease with chaperone function